MQLRLLGSPQLAVAGQLLPCAPYALRLLAVLALGGPQARLNVAGLLWEGESQRVLHNLRMALLKLRRTLGAHLDVLQERGGTLSLDLERVWVDILEEAVPHAEFMQGHRTQGSESWLSWAAEQEEHWCPAPLENWASGPRKPPFRTLDEAYLLEAEARQAVENDRFLLAQQRIRQAIEKTNQPSADIFYTAAYLYDLLGQSQQAETLAREGLARLPVGVSPTCFYAIIASSYDTRGDHQTARLWHELALQEARRFVVPEQFCEAVSFFLWHLNVTGDSARTRTLAQEALHFGDFRMTTPYILNSLGVAESKLGRLDQAFEAFSSQFGHAVSSLSIISQVRSARIYGQSAQQERALALLERTLPAVQRTEDGRARYEWAAAALLIDPQHWQAQAQASVRGAVTNDSAIVAEYQYLFGRLHN